MTVVRDLNEVTLDDIVQLRRFDYFFGYLCSESRSVHVLKRAYQICEKRYMFIGRLDPLSDEPIHHPTWAKRAKVVKVNLYEEEDVQDEMETALSEIFKSHSLNAPISILIDISSMPRVVMASIMAFLDELTSIFPNVKVVIAYCLAKYSPPSDRYIANKTVRPVHAHFTGFSLDPGLPVASIVGLGYEKGKALGAVEYIESSNWWIFIPTSEEKKYYKKVAQHNQTILKVVSERQKFDYSVHSPLQTLATLESLVSVLVTTHKTVLLPFGPKIFFLCALLTALVHKRCTVWDVTGEYSKTRADVSPSAFVMCMELSLFSD